MWVRIDDGLPRHPKFRSLTVDAAWLWLCGNCYASEYLTDGFVSIQSLPTISIVPIQNVTEQAARLVAAGLWHEAEGGFRIHDFHDFNPTAEQVKLKQEADRIRKRSASKPNPQGFQADSQENPSGLHADSKRPSRPVPSRPVCEKPELDRPLDECFAEFQSAYPAERRQGGWMAQQGFLSAVKALGDYVALLARLEQHKRSEQWVVAKKIPNMRKWFEDELWRQELAPPKAGNGNGRLVSGGRAQPPSVDELRAANARRPVES
jgi:hypothetical protein